LWFGAGAALNIVTPNIADVLIAAVRKSMPNVTASPSHWFVKAGIGRMVASVAGLLLCTTPIVAQKHAGARLFIPNPITEAGVKNLIAETQREMNAAHKAPKRLVFHFKGPLRGDYTSCLELANFFRKTEGNHELLAYVEGEITGHAVLPLLTFKRVYLAEESGYGAVHEAEPEMIPPSWREEYLLAANFGLKPPPLVLKMLYPSLALYRTDQGFRIHGDYERLQLSKEIRSRWGISDEERLNKPTIKESGSRGYFRGADEAVAFDLAKEAGLTIQQLISLLELDNLVLRRNPVVGAARLKAGVIDIRGVDAVIDGGTKESVINKIKRAIDREKCNYLIFVLEVGGGPNSVAPALDLARAISEAGDSVMTVAYIPTKATGAAVFVALACHEIVMAPGAQMHCRELVYRARDQRVAEADLEVVRKAMDAATRDRIEGLAQALLDPQPEMVHAALRRGQKGFPLERFLTREQFAQKDQDNNPRWEERGFVKRAGELLELNADDALRWGIAQKKVQENTPAAVAALYGIESADVVALPDSFLDQLASWLRLPLVTVLLVILGFTCLLLELKSPGVGLPAIVAAVCFVLVFWAHSALAGELLSLAVLLFLLGLVLLGVELFILPGFGVTGISGAVLLLLSLTLVAVGKWPSSAADWGNMLMYLGIFGAALLAAMLSAYTIARYLPQIPYANRLVLKPPEEEPGEAAAVSSTLAQAPTLLGAIGVAVTELRPAGKARFGDQYLDVATEGAFLPVGVSVQIIEIDGTRIIVKVI
jgi:membrane-bound serine protease (ClpP class)